MTLIDLMSSFAHILLIFSVAFGQSIGIKEDRRRLTSNENSCNEIDYGLDVGDCIPFYDLMFWESEFLNKICYADGSTDKSIEAELCSSFADNDDYALSLKLAILNTMYGTADIQPDNCAY